MILQHPKLHGFIFFQVITLLDRITCIYLPLSGCQEKLHDIFK